MSFYFTEEKKIFYFSKLKNTHCCVSSFDTRDQDVTEARHWSDVHIMAGRAFFREQEVAPHLALENVLASDIGSYKCRVDFYKAPTQISEVLLNVIGKMCRVGLNNRRP